MSEVQFIMLWAVQGLLAAGIVGLVVLRAIKDWEQRNA